MTLPETAIVRNGKPVFLPDYALPAELSLHLAVRICRLGRCVSSRFAHRYYDAVTIVPRFTAPQLLAEAREQGLPWSVATGFDGSLPLGHFVPLDVLIAPFELRLQIDGQSALCVPTGVGCMADIDVALAQISEFYTLRNGDLLLLPSPTEPLMLEPEHHIETFLNEECLLAFNLK